MAELVSIAVRVRRVTTEVAYVSVPLTEELVADLTKPGKASILVAEACRLAEAPETKWYVEEQSGIEVHPIQQPRPE